MPIDRCSFVTNERTHTHSQTWWYTIHGVWLNKRKQHTLINQRTQINKHWTLFLREKNCLTFLYCRFLSDAMSLVGMICFCCFKFKFLCTRRIRGICFMKCINLCVVCVFIFTTSDCHCRTDAMATLYNKIYRDIVNTFFACRHKRWIDKLYIFLQHSIACTFGSRLNICCYSCQYIWNLKMPSHFSIRSSF